MKKSISILIGVTCIVALSREVFKLRRSSQQYENQLTILKAENDSLKAEMFTKDIQAGRLDILVERVEAEMSPDCKEEFEKLLHTIE